MTLLSACSLEQRAQALMPDMSLLQCCLMAIINNQNKLDISMIMRNPRITHGKQGAPLPLTLTGETMR